MIFRPEQHGISTKQAESDADSLITATVLTLASEQRPVVVLEQIQICLLFLYLKQTSQMSLHMCGNNPPIVHNI